MTETRSSIKNLEMQVGKLENMLQSRPQGNFPSNIETNPKEQCNAISLRSSKEVVEPVEKSSLPSKMEYEKKNKMDEEVNENLEKKNLEISIEHHIKVPYPQRLEKKTLDNQFFKFLDIFQKLHINIHFAEALEQMSSYVKFMKEILSKKRKLEDYETVALIAKCIAILQKKLPPKFKDSGSFTIPCTIGNVVFEKALCDLGEGVNLNPLSIYKKLKLGEARPTTASLQMADRSVKHPRGGGSKVEVTKRKVIAQVGSQTVRHCLKRFVSGKA
ncbi:uncharacterized protein LOC133814784 [Humulus lupulus]|uniref:uncharacterized protein LOC133814784 n=1 Tax=Humulus lupulus TaxID=3486 RepID=UPI002B4158D7|nr:uncharacterized protein LOC133814784 [Humulus lupulus]